LIYASAILIVYTSVYPFQEGDEGSQYSKCRGIDKSFCAGKVTDVLYVMV